MQPDRGDPVLLHTKLWLRFNFFVVFSAEKTRNASYFCQAGEDVSDAISHLLPPEGPENALMMHKVTEQTLFYLTVKVVCRAAYFL